MNIKEAKEQIEETVKVYLSKDAYGGYLIPVVRQRPVFLLGAPGIGKTAIMEQIAAEMNIALVSYSMTHHTRQSALGLPLIRKRTFGGAEVQVTEYTMSEIIASVYGEMEKTGKREGILFLDEINCVSETLSPSMLQFLQYKVFGTHRVPDGWVVVTAGNPPQFNRSVREFDVVTMDRMKILEIDPDYPAWREYAENRKIHRAILTYLDIRKDNFYVIETKAEGKTYVTGRGWEDLSEMMLRYEELGFTVDETLIGQYLRNPKIAQDFAIYYELFNKYKSDYQIFDILGGTENDDVRLRSKKAAFDERISLMGLLLDAVLSRISQNVKTEKELRSLRTVLIDVREKLAADGETPQSPEFILKMTARRAASDMERDRATEALSPARRDSYEFVIDILKKYRILLKLEGTVSPEAAFPLLKKDYDTRIDAMTQDAGEIKEMLNHLFAFTEKVFGIGNEMLILVTELTVHSDSVVFIGQYGCDAYAKYSKSFQLYQRQQELLSKLNEISTDTLQAEADRQKVKLTANEEG